MRLLVLFFVTLVFGDALAQQAPPARLGADLSSFNALAARHSLSGQFVIHNPVRTGWLASVGTSTNIVRLEPALLAVSCERIKRAVLRQLNANGDRWRGTICIDLHPARSLDETIQVIATQFRDGWAYDVNLPDTIERSRLVAAVVELLLLEMANRNSTGRSAEIPAWLVQGLAQQIMFDSEVDLVLQPPDKMESGVSVFRTIRSERKLNPLVRAHDQLSTNAPLTLEELSWPGEDQFKGAAGDAFRSSAQLLVCELAEDLPGGRNCLREFVRQLPQHLNWQISFLQAFHSHFTTQRDLEKWWALRLQTFTTRDLAQTWPSDETIRKLDEIIRPPVQVRTATNALPLHAEVPLQTIIRDWDYPKQRQILQVKLQQLAVLRIHASQDVISLIDGYRQAIENYIKECDKASLVRLAKFVSTPRLGMIIDKAIHELDGLDAHREEVRSKPQAADRAAATPQDILLLVN